MGTHFRLAGRIIVSSFIFFGLLSLVNSCKKSSIPAIPILPTITSISPNSGLAGVSVTISGTNFDATPANNTVKFNGTPATVTAATATSLLVTAPVGGATGAIRVTNSNGGATGPVFTYLVAPTITSINPVSGPAGTSVTISGANFDATVANNTVKFNGVQASITSATTTSIVTVAPATGTTGNITVATNVASSNGILFTYISGPTLYISGSQTNGDNGYWTNSSFNKVAACNNPISIAGSGTDLYLAGGSTTNTPTYWKNGVAVQLSANTGYLLSIIVSGTDVYCSGGIGTSLLTWKNGVSTTLTAIPAGSSIAHGNHALFVSNTDVYAVGWQFGASPNFYQKATYWKNGTPVYLTPGTTGNAQATAVYVSGTDVYVAGTEEESSGGSIVNHAPRLWKNGVSVPLTTPANSFFNSVSSLLLVGSDVYVGGQYNGAGALWKNGTMINTASYALAENVSSLFLFNAIDLYAGGASAVSGKNGYWKNGNFIEMDPGCGAAGPGCAGTSANDITGMYVK